MGFLRNSHTPLESSQTLPVAGNVLDDSHSMLDEVLDDGSVRE